MRPRLPGLLVGLMLTLALASCSTPPSGPQPDAASKEAGLDGAGLDSTIPLTIPKGGLGAANVGEDLASGGVRAGTVKNASELLSGIKVQGRVGDFKIYNDRIAFIIARARPTNGYSPFGGELLDGQRLDLPAQKGRSLLGETILGAGTQVIETQSVGVINDGSDGKAAIVRVIGEPSQFPLLSSILPLNRPAPVYLVVDYVLEASSDALELRWRFINKTHREVKLPLTLLGVFAGDGLDFFADEVGQAIVGAREGPWIGLVGQEISYGFLGRDGVKLKPLISYQGVWALSTGGVTVPGGGEATQLLNVVIAEGGPEALRRTLRRHLGETEPTAVTGSILDPAKAPVVGARVHVRSDDSKTYITMTRSDAKGHYAVNLPPGAYRLTVVADGRLPTKETTIQAAKTEVIQDLNVDGTATVTFTVADTDGSPLPAKLIFMPKNKPTALPKSFGEATFPGGAARVLFHLPGEEKTTLAPGTYTVTASRGFEYELDTQTITLAAGDTKALSFSLKHSVDTTGYMCGDFHLHAMWSPDSSDLYDFKVASFAAGGLELAVATDHEYITDYTPFIKTLGLERWVFGIIGEELTTFAYGHFNPYPITIDTTQPNNGAVLWWDRSPPQLFDDVRARWPSAIFQINHPRSAPISGYFNYVGYDPETGKTKQPAEWSLNFDAVEVYNASGWDRNKSTTVRDWFSFLDRGKKATATGNSDSHHSYSSEVGYPRNYVRLSTDSPKDLNLGEFVQAIKHQQVLVSGGPFVTVDIGGKSLGEVADATAKKVTLKVKVQAPQWIAVDTLRVILGGKVGGDEVKTLTLDKSTADPQNPTIRYDDSLEIAVTRDTWVVVVVQGKGTLAPVALDKKPFAMTNPIYLDVDGNGRYDPPLSF